MPRSVLISFTCAILFTPLVLSYLGVVGAQVMSSESYQMESDSINVSGGRATSESYTMEQTVGEVATGDSDSETFALRAGFQQMQEVFISITAPESVVMSPSIPGVAGGVANGSTSVTVTTDSPSGYELRIAAETDPALQTEGGTYTIADYEPSGSSDFSFAIGANDAHLGYTIESDDAATHFVHDGGTCGVGSQNTGDACWAGLATTSAVAATRSESNHPNGIESTVHFRVGVGGDVVQPPGMYTGTTTVTALPL